MQLLSSGTCISVKVASFDFSEQIITMASESTEGDFLLVAVWRVLDTPTLSCSNELGIFERPQTISFIPGNMFSTAKEIPTPQSFWVLLGSLQPAWVPQHPFQHLSLPGCSWGPCSLHGYLTICVNTSALRCSWPLLPAWVPEHPFVGPFKRFTHCSQHFGFSHKTVCGFYFKEHS